MADGDGRETRRGAMRRWFLRGVVGAVVLGVLLLAAALLVAPRYLASESLQARVQAEASRAAGGTVEFEGLGLSLFPRPGLVVREAVIKVPGKVTATVASLKACPAILPLFAGEVRLARLRLSDAEARISLPAAHKGEQAPPGKKEGPRASLQEALKPVVAGISRQVPGLVVIVERGAILLLEGERPLFTFRHIDARITLPPKGPKIRLRCSSNLWKRISVRGKFDLYGFRGDARIQVDHLRPQLLTARFLPGAEAGLAEAVVNLDLRVRALDAATFSGELEASIPLLTLRRRNKATLIKANRIRLSFRSDPKALALSLETLELSSPRLRMTGEFTLDRDPRWISVNLRAEDLDVVSARRAALAIGGDVRVVRNIFDIVRGGVVPAITFHSHGKSFFELGLSENMIIQGRLHEGRIYIAAPDLDLVEVEGRADISGGILKGTELEARLGKTRGYGGTLRVGLEDKDAPFHLEINVEADLAQLPPVLGRLVKEPTFRRELALVKDLKGKAQGRMILGENLQRIDAVVDVSSLRLSARYGRIPYPITVDRGRFHYDKEWVSVGKLSGRVGASRLASVDFEVELKDDPSFSVHTGRCSLRLDELYPWLLSFESLRQDLAEFPGAEGTVILSGLSMKGPLFRSSAWSFDARGSLLKVTLRTTLCPGPLRIAKGSFKAVPAVLGFEEAQAALLDTSATVSAELTGYLTHASKATMRVRHGRLGAELLGWIWRLAALPPEILPRAPVVVKGGRLSWEREGTTSFSGALSLPSGPKLSVRIAEDPAGLRSCKFTVRDAASRADFTYHLRDDGFDAGFSGNLEQATIERLLAEPQTTGTHVGGEIRLRYRPGEAVPLEAIGGLSARDVVMPFGWLSLIRIDSIVLASLEDKSGIRIDSAALRLADEAYTVSGTMALSSEGPSVDLDLAGGDVEWDVLARLIDAMGEQEVEEAAEETDKGGGTGEAEEVGETAAKMSGPPGPHVQGVLRCRCESFRYDRFRWAPLRAEVTLSAEQGVSVEVTEADMVGIDSTGELLFAPDGEISVSLRLLAEDQDLQKAADALFDGHLYATGRFDLQGEIKGKGRPEELVRAVKGTLRFSARKGEIYRDKLLARIFSVLNVTELIRGKLPDLTTEAVPYDTFNSTAELADGTAHFKTLLLAGPTVEIVGEGRYDLVKGEMDLQLLVAPLKTVDFIVNNTPMVKWITGGTLLTVPVRVRGTREDPEVSMLSGKVVGNRLLQIMKNTLHLPLDIVSPVLSRGGDSDSGE